LHRNYLLIVTAVLEGAIGLLLLVAPARPIVILLGVEGVGADAIAMSRIAGAALLALGAACWLARNDDGTRAQTGLLTGVLIYDAAVAVALVFIGTVSQMAGVLLWPAVALHSVLTVWCVVCIRSKPVGRFDNGGSSSR
jgi:hypothetical protein